MTGWQGMNYHFPNLLLDKDMAPILLHSKQAGLILGWNDKKEDCLPKKDSTANLKEKSSPTMTEELSPGESATTLYTCAVSSPTPMGGQKSWSSTTSLDTDGVLSPTSKWQPSSPVPSTIPCTDLAPVPRFKKSRVLAGEAAHISLKMRLQALKVGYNVNPNYRGEINQFTIDNARCPPEQNCALHITDIDPEATLQEIFGVILEGKVFSFHKKNTIPGKFDTCAATLVFMERQPAELFLARSCEYPGINIRGSQIRAIWNREPVGPRPGSEQRQSRVLLITGPQHEFTGEGLERFFHSRLDFNLVDRREWLEAGGQRTVEFHFSRIQGQSRLAFKCFCVELDEQGAKDKFSIRYGVDPCDQLNSIKIAKLYRY
jgi:hypothetical protein